MKASAQHGLFPDTNRIDWETPQHIFDELDAEFKFTLDVCATPDNAKCERFFTPQEDGLRQDWTRDRCWMNPPYGREIVRWVRKASASWVDAVNRPGPYGFVVVGLVPARTDTAWWHDYIQGRAEIRFIRGRLRFGRQQLNPAPFPSAVVVWG